MIEALQIRAQMLRGHAQSLRGSYTPPGTVADDQRLAEIERDDWLAGQFEQLAETAQRRAPVPVRYEPLGDGTYREVPGG
jgi:hypothetical protein